MSERDLKESELYKSRFEEKESSSWWWLVAVLCCCVLAVFGVRYYFTSHYGGVVVDGASMDKTLADGQQLLMEYVDDGREADRGDIIVLDVSKQQFFPPDSPNMSSPFSYMSLMRAALALMPELEHVDRILSLDVDTVCVRDVSNIWDMPVDGLYFSASREDASCFKNMLYCNTGVTLYNLEQLRDGKAQEVVDCLNWRRYPNIEQDVFSFLCQGRIHEMPSEYNAGHRWTERTNVVRIRHFAGDKHDKWSKSPEFDAWRRVTWDEALEMHAKAVRRNG